MENKMQLVGHYSFQSKDKQNTFFVIQCLATEKKQNNGLKSVLVSIFVEATEFAEIAAMDYGSELTVQSTINFETGKASHKIIL